MVLEQLAKVVTVMLGLPVALQYVSCFGLLAFPLVSLRVRRGENIQHGTTVPPDVMLY
jgi:hypothetical protein